jgi:hypothetical protein
MMQTFIEECVTVREYADRCRVTPKAVYQWINDSGLPSLNPHGRTLIHIPTANDWHKSRVHTKNQRRVA